MKIPKALRIGGCVYDVIFDSDRQKNSGNFSPASCNLRNHKIWIDKNQSPSAQERSLLHEILEIVDYNGGLDLEHQKIVVLESMLYAALKDNGLLK